MTPAPRDRRRTWSTVVGVAVGGLAYFLTLFDYATDTTRTANALGYASNFFDYQGRALLDGHLWVPDGSLGIEAFVRDDRQYMYFGPVPALLRLPVLMTTHEFDGQLTLLSMAVAFVLMAVMTTKLVWLVRDRMRDDDSLGRFEAGSMALFLALCLGGTTLTFVASLPWAYHEVYAWAVPLVIGSFYWMLRVLAEPSQRNIGWLAAFAVAAVLTRTTGGWAVCLATIGIGLWLAYGRLSSGSRRVGWRVVAAGAIALIVGVALNWAKFRHPYLFPLEDQVWTALNAHRREALEVNGGTITGPQFFTTSLYNYFRPDGIRFVPYFPWITLPAQPAPAIGDTFIDQSYRTGSVTSFMPVLLALTVLAVPAVFRRGLSEGRRMLRAPLVAGVLVTGGVMAYGYLAFRYTCEFIPALVVGGAIGVSALNGWLVKQRRLLKGAALAVLAVATSFSVAAQMLVGFSAAAVTAGGPSLARYLEIQQDWAWPGPGPRLSSSTSAPQGGDTDDLHAESDCEALWLNTGDAYNRWQLVERRSVVVEVLLEPDFGATEVRLATVGTEPEGVVTLQTNSDGEARVVLVTDEGEQYPGQWFDVLPPGRILVGVGDKPALGYAEVSATPGGFIGYLRSFTWDDEWRAERIAIRPDYDNNTALRALGITVRERPGIDPPLCRRLVVAAGDEAP